MTFVIVSMVSGDGQFPITMTVENIVLPESSWNAKYGCTDSANASWENEIFRSSVTAQSPA